MNGFPSILRKNYINLKFINISIFLNLIKTSLLPVEIRINIYKIKWEQWYFHYTKVGVYMWTSVLSKSR